MCDNKGAIDLSKNPFQHSRIKHIEMRHHFLRDNVANTFAKPLKRELFNHLHLGLGMMEQIDWILKNAQNFLKYQGSEKFSVSDGRTP